MSEHELLGQGTCKHKQSLRKITEYTPSDSDKFGSSRARVRVVRKCLVGVYFRYIIKSNYAQNIRPE